MKLLRKGILSLMFIVLVMNFNPLGAMASNSAKINNLTTGVYPDFSGTIRLATPPPTFQVFFDLLSPYGSWVQYGNYGYCWVPNEGADFVPYSTNGHWVYTVQGWQWFSNYSWGWAPFHYGRWVYEDDYGWIWVPGHDWAPAWVVWGHYNGYYGWAPVAPGVILSIGYRPPLHYWNFVPEGRITEVNIGRFMMRDRNFVHGNIDVIYNEHRYNNIVFNRGPKVEEIERVTGRKYSPVAEREADHPLNNREIKYANKDYQHNRPMNVYRPPIEHNNNFHGAPKKVEKLENLKRSNNKNDRGGQKNNNDYHEHQR